MFEKNKNTKPEGRTFLKQKKKEICLKKKKKEKKTGTTSETITEGETNRNTTGKKDVNKITTDKSDNITRKIIEDISERRKT